jgi:hypothetical protein
MASVSIMRSTASGPVVQLEAARRRHSPFLFRTILYNLLARVAAAGRLWLASVQWGEVNVQQANSSLRVVPPFNPSN